MMERMIAQWSDFKRKVWQRLVQIGRRNPVYRVGILSGVAVCLFFRHLLRYAKATPVRRCVSVCCACLLVLNSIQFPRYVWAAEEGDWIVEQIAGDDTQGLVFEVKGPSEPTIEGYQEPVKYLLRVTNPDDGRDLSGIRVKATMSDVYMANESGIEGVCIFSWAEDGQEEAEHPSSDDGAEAEGTESEESTQESTEEEPGGTEEESTEEPTEGMEEEPMEEPTEGTEEESTEEPTEGTEEEPMEEPTEGTEEESAEEPTEGTEEEPAEEPTEGTEEEPMEEPTEGTEEESADVPEESEDSEMEQESEDGTGVSNREAAGGSRMLGASSSIDLSAGQELYLCIHIPVGLSAGDSIETLTFYTNELDRPIVKKISVIVGTRHEEEEDSPDTSMTEDTEGTETSEGEEPSEAPATGESSSEEEPADTQQDEETGDMEDQEQEENDPEETPVELEPLEIVSREGGYYIGQTFIVLSPAVFHLTMDTNAIMSLFCEMGEVSEELEIVDGSASFDLPEKYSGMLRFYTVDEEGNVVDELTEYVVAEKKAPILDYANVTSSTDGSEMVRVTIEDCGDIVSGLEDLRCVIDGELFTGYQVNEYGKTVLCGGEEVTSELSFDIPLLDAEVHTIEITATDHAGNSMEKRFRVRSAEWDVVSVILPTSFGMAIFPYASNGNIWGDDIMIANQGDFPIEVTLKSATIEIDHTYSEEGASSDKVKDASLSMNVNLSNGRHSQLDLAEGYSRPGETFILAAKNPETDAEALQKQGNEKPVLADDYAILNVRGVISEGSESCWKSGDIVVSLTFTFKRVEMPEEELGDLGETEETEETGGPEESESPEETEEVVESEESESSEEPHEHESSEELDDGIPEKKEDGEEIIEK